MGSSFYTSYINRRGETVQVLVTRHATERFRQRWELMFPNKALPGPAHEALAEWFARAQRFEPQGRKYESRIKRYGKDTLFFKANPFIFVVQDAAIKTVELGTRDSRPLNKLAGQRPARAAEPRPQPLPQEGPKAQSLFKLTGACAMDYRSSTYFVNLGSYESAPFGGDPEKLRHDPAFKDEVLKRFEAKRKGWILRAVLAKLGSNGAAVTVLEEQGLRERREGG